MPSVIVKSDVPSISALAEPDAIWSGLTLYTEPSVTSSKIKKSLEVSTVMLVPSAKLDGSTVRSTSPDTAPPAKPESAFVLTAVISPVVGSAGSKSPEVELNASTCPLVTPVVSTSDKSPTPSVGCIALSANAPCAEVANAVLSLPSKVSASTLRASTNALSTLVSIAEFALASV